MNNSSFASHRSNSTVIELELSTPSDATQSGVTISKSQILAVSSPKISQQYKGPILLSLSLKLALG